MSSIPKRWRDRNLLTFAVVLRSGGDYVKEDPIILSRQVMRHLHIPHRFICLTDLQIDDFYVEEFPLENNWPGWWSVIELFRITGPVIVTGLDTLIIDSIDRLGEMALTCPETDFYMTRPQPDGIIRGEKFCSGMMIWNGDWSWLYKGFIPHRHIDRFRREQRYTTWQLLKNNVNVRTLQKEFDGFYSYKNDCRKEVPADAKVIGFHGHPRPREAEDKWVHDVLNDYSLPPHSFVEVFEKAHAEGI